MAEVKLAATRREDTGKGSARRSRAAGKVPGVIYGRGLDPIPIEVDRREFVTALLTESGANTLLDIEVDGKTILTLAREMQRDPVRGTLIHADLVQIDRMQEVDAEVRAHIVGTAPGVGEGGVLQQPMHTLHVRARPAEVPEAIEVDVSAMGVGDSLRVGELHESRAFHILDDPDAVVVTIVAPITEEELEAMEAEVGAVPEVPEAAEAPAPEEQVEELEEAAPSGEAESPPAAP